MATVLGPTIRNIHTSEALEVSIFAEVFFSLNKPFLTLLSEQSILAPDEYA